MLFLYRHEKFLGQSYERNISLTNREKVGVSFTFSFFSWDMGNAITIIPSTHFDNESHRLTSAVLWFSGSPWFCGSPKWVISNDGSFWQNCQKPHHNPKETPNEVCPIFKLSKLESPKLTALKPFLFWWIFSVKSFTRESSCQNVTPSNGLGKD